MRSRLSGPARLGAVVTYAVLGGVCGVWACGSQPSSGFGGIGADGGRAGDGTVPNLGTDSGKDGQAPHLGQRDTGTTTHDGATTTVASCPAGTQCNVECSGGTTTTVTGKIYDPGGNDPLYNVEVYVPGAPLAPLPKGVVPGCACGSLFESGAVVATATGVDGSFTLKNVPVGTSVPIVAQVGKWRRQFNIAVTACEANAQPDKSLKLPSSITDPNDNMPDIAVSTGGLDTLECLMTRIGLPSSEFTPGAGGTGHVHIFSGGQGPNDTGGTGGGSAESPPMTGAPESYKALWDSQTHMMAYDVVMLSCEGDETYNANPPVLEQYLNAGGRAFASHYHYAWFAGTLDQGNTPAPPSDWGSNIADWQSASFSFGSGSATVVQTLTGTNTPFQKGEALFEWLASNGALGVEGAAANRLPIFDENGDVGATNKAQPWLTDGKNTDYLSFNTPINAPAAADGGAPAYCGRAVFADIHVDSDPNFPQDTNPPPSGCSTHKLSPQEKALEFMLFDLSSCVVPDVSTVAADAGFPIIPK